MSAFAWLQRNERPVLWGATGFQVLVLVAMIVLKLSVLLTGDTVLLRVQPVDPRDLFRGDYVILGYAFSSVPPQNVAGLSSRPEEREGKTVYAVLERESDGLHWQATRFTVDRPESGTFLRGSFSRWDRVEYGIESFFVQEGKGHGYEEAVRNRRLSAKVAVSHDGKAVVKELVVE